MTFVRIMTHLMLLAAAAFALACGEPADAPQQALADAAQAEDAAFAWPEGPHPVATIQVEGLGEIEVELYPSLAPSTVRNFTKLANKGFYAGTTFHRVIPGFIIQGGDPNTKDDDPGNDGEGGPGWHIQDEFTAAPHVRGILSMANTGTPNSGSSQFFLTHADARHLDGKHTVFGRVTRGLEVLDAIAAVKTDEYGRWGPSKRPLADVVITRIDIREPGEPAPEPSQQAGKSKPPPNSDV